MEAQTISDFLNQYGVIVKRNPVTSAVFVIAALKFVQTIKYKYRLKNAEAKISSLHRQLTKIADDQEKARRNSITLEDNQVKAVQSYNAFERKRIFNKEETPIFYLLLDILKQTTFKGWHVHGQVCLGEIIKTAPEDFGEYWADRAHKSINSKRSDMVVTDNTGSPIILVEYNGDGHWGADRDKAEKRDLVKSIAAAKAGIEVVTLFPDPVMSRKEKHAALSAALFAAAARSGMRRAG